MSARGVTAIYNIGWQVGTMYAGEMSKGQERCAGK